MELLDKLKNKDDGGEVKTYACPWPNCGAQFSLTVRKAGGGLDATTGGKADAVSTQVVCPECGNGLKTW